MTVPPDLPAARPADRVTEAGADAGGPARTMRCVVVSADSIDVITAPVPRPGPAEALVRSTVAGVCGSDTHAAHGRHPWISLPYRPGHEVVGVVEQVGVDVASFGPGRRVTVEPDLPCWECKMCTSGRENVCEKLVFFGCGWNQGGMADYFTIAANRLHAVPDDLDDATAALIEPLSTPVHAVRLAGVGVLPTGRADQGIAGRTVAVLGAGTIGLLVLSVLKVYGAGRVVVTDVLASKRDRAWALGADAVVDAADPNVVDRVRAELGQSADVVFDCVAVESTIGQAVGMAGKGGTVVVVGVPTGDVTVPLQVLQDQEIRIQGSATYLPDDFAESVRLLQSGAVRAADFVTATLPVADVARAFALSGGSDHVKVLVSFDAA